LAKTQNKMLRHMMLILKNDRTWMEGLDRSIYKPSPILGLCTF
jgi:hypothetical protein